MKHLGSCPRTDSDSLGLGWGLIFCISNKFPDDAYAAGLRTTLFKTTVQNNVNDQSFTNHITSSQKALQQANQELLTLFFCPLAR